MLILRLLRVKVYVRLALQKKSKKNSGPICISTTYYLSVFDKDKDKMNKNMTILRIRKIEQVDV